MRYYLGALAGAKTQPPEAFPRPREEEPEQSTAAPAERVSIPEFFRMMKEQS